MRFETLPVRDAMLVRLQTVADERGFFARTFCVKEFESAGLPHLFAQASISLNRKCGTVRGMHFQWPPSSEAKLVRCTRGALYDVMLDLRPDSPTYLHHAGVSLDAENRDAVFIPHGVAHGFQTLLDDTEIFYQMTDYFEPGLAGGVRWNDPAFGIDWPLAAVLISDRDAEQADFDRPAYEAELRRRRV